MNNVKKIIISIIFSTCITLIYLPSIHASGEAELSRLNTLEFSQRTNMITSPDGEYILTYGYIGGSELWKISSGAKKKIKTDLNINTAAFSPDGASFALSVGGVDRISKIMLFNSKSGELVDSIPIKNAAVVSKIDFLSNNKQLLAFTSESRLLTIDILTKQVVSELEVLDTLSSIQVNPVKNEYALLFDDNVSYNSNKTKMIQFRNASTGDIIKTITESYSTKTIDIDTPNFGTDQFNDFTYSPNGKYFIYSYLHYNKSKTLLYDVESNYSQLAEIKDFGSLSFSKDNKLVLIGDHIYPIEDKLSTSYKVAVKNSSDVINPYASYLTKDGRYLIYSNDNIVVNILDAGNINVTLSSIKIEPETLSLDTKSNNIQEVKAVGIYSNGLKKELDSSKVNWSTDDFSIAQVKGNKVYAQAIGDTQLIASYGEITAKATIKVADSKSTETNNTVSQNVSEGKRIELQIDNPYMKINGISKEIDEGNGTVPVMLNGRTLLPIRALIAELGGTLQVNGEQKIIIKLNDKDITLWINNTVAEVNGSKTKLDVAPKLINGRTMLPIRFIGENLGLNLEWDSKSQLITLTTEENDNASMSKSDYWYDMEYTQPVSNKWGKYIDGGIGFSINYPLAWGKPKVIKSNKYSYKTYTQFYKSDISTIISYGDSLTESTTYEDYLQRKGFTIDDVAAIDQMKNSDQVYYISKNTGKQAQVVVMIFKMNEVCVLEHTILDTGRMVEGQEAIDLFKEMLTTFELDLAVG